MSRSRPQEHLSNPATRWFEWNGEQGVVRYYDKEKKENVVVEGDFGFVLLDELGTVKGWHEPSESGIYANEVRDTRQDVMIVKAFKAGTLAEGLYKNIKDRVHTLGGQFVSNCYIGFKNGGGSLSIGSVQFKGAALQAWMEFRKANRGDLYSDAIKIAGFTEGKKGRIVYRVPKFKIVELAPETHTEAVKLDDTLQNFLDGYLARNKQDQAEAVSQVEPDNTPTYDHSTPINDSEIPF